MSWIHKTSMFAKSMGVLSAVSYVFGEMDTSPSGILIDKVSGATTYTQCVATGERKPVPFRLTPSIVAAFGTCGVGGPFKQALTNSLEMTRKRAASLANILQFVVCKEPYEPRTIPKEYARFGSCERADGGIDEFYGRIIGKGTVGTHVQELISAATSMENMAKMPGRWMPWL